MQPATTRHPSIERKTAVVTGAGGGIGRVCARRVAARFSLVLNEFREPELSAISSALRDEDGAEIAAEITGDLGDPEVLARIVAACGNNLGAVVHTAGQSTQTAGWEAILHTNLVATARLLDALEPVLAPGAAAVLIASIARVMAPPPSPEMLKVMEYPHAPDFIERMKPLLGADDAERGGAAYCYSKWWVHREVQRRTVVWAKKGARIMSISPGMIWTRMGRLSLQDGPGAALVEATPAGRWGRPSDIADAVEFILSDRASFLTGSDILIDGGIAARVLTQGASLGNDTGRTEA